MDLLPSLVVILQSYLGVVVVNNNKVSVLKDSILVEADKKLTGFDPTENTLVPTPL